MNATQRPILVTGSHRSGTTWVGEMLASAPGVAYIHEPFNVIRRHLGVFGARFEHWMTYVSAENAAQYRDALADMLAFRYHYGSALRDVRGPLDVLRLVKNGAQFARNRISGRRALVKDPIAIFSAPWLHETFGMDVVVLIRHPAAFVNSIVRLDWRFDFRDLTAQPALLRDLLAPFEAEIRARAAAGPGDRYDEAAFLWKLIHHAIAGYEERYPRWSFVRHEDLATDPIPQFEKLFAALGLEFSAHAQQTIRQSSSDENPRERDDRSPHTTQLASKHVRRSWASKLSADQIARIREITAPYSERWYSAADWAVS